jgi:hypothetical protein
MIIRKLVAGALAAAAVAVVAPATAHAITGFSNCAGSCESLGTFGDIIWHNRTATVDGWVTDTGPGWTQGVFIAYRAGRQVGLTETRTADDQNSRLGSPRRISFVMGDTNLPGGIDEIWVNLCWDNNRCNGWKVYNRN